MLTFLTLQFNFNLSSAIIIRLVYAIIILLYLVIDVACFDKGGVPPRLIYLYLLQIHTLYCMCYLDPTINTSNAHFVKGRINCVTRFH